MIETVTRSVFFVSFEILEALQSVQMEDVVPSRPGIRGNGFSTDAFGYEK